MASTRRTYSHSHCFANIFSPLIVLLIAIRPSQTEAQLQDPPVFATSTTVPTLVADPTDGDVGLLPAPAPLSAVPSATDGAGYDSQQDGDRGILNYYFLLLAVFIIIIFIGYWAVARRRRNRLLRLQSLQQSALARDVHTWPGSGRGLGPRWRTAGADTSMEEGLDERGEAPPPYLKEPEPVHHNGREEMELQHMPRQEGKPPEYHEGPSGS